MDQEHPECCSLIRQGHLQKEITFNDLSCVLLWAIQVAYNIGNTCPWLHEFFFLLKSIIRFLVYRYAMSWQLYFRFEAKKKKKKSKHLCIRINFSWLKITPAHLSNNNTNNTLLIIFQGTLTHMIPFDTHIRIMTT